MSNRYAGLVVTLIVRVGVLIAGVAQTPVAGKTLAVAGHTGQAAVVQMNGKTL